MRLLLLAPGYGELFLLRVESLLAGTGKRLSRKVATDVADQRADVHIQSVKSFRRQFNFNLLMASRRVKKIGATVSRAATLPSEGAANLADKRGRFRA